MEEFYKALLNYHHSKMYPMHMPGHKRNINQNDLLEQIRAIDITEIPNFDDQYENTGYLKLIQDRYAKMYHSSNSRVMVNGSTGGILAAISCTTNHGDMILMGRNAHKSAYNACMINDLEIEYIYPEISNLGILSEINAESIDHTLKQNPMIKAVYITSPTYEGVISDIESIARIVHNYHIPLIVDEAHGPHLGMDELYQKQYGMDSAVHLGADIVIQSLHKTLPAFTQSAIIHYRDEYIDVEKLERYLMVYQSSSPSYILLAGMERCIDIIEQQGKELFKNYHDHLEYFYNSVKDLKYLYVVDGLQHFKRFDRGKIIIYLPDHGKILYQLLREKYFIEPEMAMKDYVLCMTSIMDTKEGFDRLINALKEIDDFLSDVPELKSPYLKIEPIKKMKISDAIKLTEFSTKDIHDYKEGEMSIHFIYAYPPGIPIITPGEVFDEKILEYFKILEEHHIELKKS